MNSLLTPENSLPKDGCAGTLVGRAQLPEGPAVVAIREDGVYDVTAAAPTMSTLLDAADPVAVVAKPSPRRPASATWPTSSPTAPMSHATRRSRGSCARWTCRR